MTIVLKNEFVYMKHLFKLKMWRIALIISVPLLVLCLLTYALYRYPPIQQSFFFSYITILIFSYFLILKPISAILLACSYDSGTRLLIDLENKHVIYKPNKELSTVHKFSFQDISSFRKYKNGTSMYLPIYYYQITLKNKDVIYITTLVAKDLELYIDTPLTPVTSKQYIYVIGGDFKEGAQPIL